MEIYPAIDLLDGKCVRLVQGDFSQKNEYSADPVAQALEFEAEGAKYIHIVDLDAAKTGEAKNRKIIKKVCEATSVFIQAGGGVRTLDDAREMADMGVDRAVVGTTAVKDPRTLEKMSELVKTAAGLDARNNKLAVEGWKVNTSLDLMDAAGAVLECGIEALVVTDIGSDGMLSGPNISMYLELQDFLQEKDSPVQLIASGGIGSLPDIKELAALKGLAGAILGKAIYEGAVSVRDALSAAGGQK